MTTVLKEQECTECGKFVTKIWRVYKNHRYCSTCYARVFKYRICPKCGNLQRLPKNILNAVCRRCETNKPCTRCGKENYAIGKITSYGVVCKTCLPYFQEPKACGLCGRLAKNLTRVRRLNIDIPVCHRCARQDHKACQACRRHRLLAKASGGRMLCKTCFEKGNVSCPKCGKSMPAGYGKQCETCYLNGLLEKRIKIDCAAFSSSQMTAHFQEFGQWLNRSVGEKKAAATIHRYLSLFIEIEYQWQAIPNYEALLIHFGASRLRQFLLPVRWMKESGFITPDTIVKEDDSNKRRIQAILKKFTKGTQELALLAGYYDSMIEKLKAEKTSIRSIRLALSPAAALLGKAREMKRMPPDQKVLDVFLDEIPGQRTALSGFICYLRDRHSVDVTLPKPNKEKIQKNLKKKLEAEMLLLMAEHNDSNTFMKQWLSVSLAYFHGLPKNVGKRLKAEEFDVQVDGITVSWDGKVYWVLRGWEGSEICPLNMLGESLWPI